MNADQEYRRIVGDAPEDMSDAERQEIDDFRSIVSTDRGRRVIWRIMSRCGTFASGSRGDAREVGLLLIDLTKAVDTAFWHLMVQENDK